MSNVPSVPAAASSLRFESFQVTEVQFRTDPSAANNTGLNYSVNFSPAGRISWDTGRYALLLGITISTDTGLFEATVQSRSVFSFNPEHDVEKLYQLATRNAPALVFPFIRAYLGTLTALSGLPTVLMPPFDLTYLAEPLRAAIEEVDEV